MQHQWIWTLLLLTPGVVPLAHAAGAVVQPEYLSPPVRSAVDTPVVVPEASPKAEGKQYFLRYGYPRAVVAIDINQDGLDDLLVAPTLFNQGPKLPLEVWINTGRGEFQNQTEQWFDGPVPTTGVSTSLLTDDFNRDGHLDVFITDQGLEEVDCVTVGCSGETSVLLLSQKNGTLRDASDTHLPGNGLNFNHITSSTGDLNGDGLPDVATARLGGKLFTHYGVSVYFNQGNGILVDRAADVLTDEVAYLPYSHTQSADRPATYDRQSSGAAAIFDVDGKGPAELLTCSYNTPDRHSGQRTVRIHQWDSSTSHFTEQARFEIADALKGDRNLGCSGIQVGDINGDGMADVLVAWESWESTHLQVMQGLGDGKFRDITLESLGGYATHFDAGGYRVTMLQHNLRDINGDGHLDLQFRAGQVKASLLASGFPTSLINDGAGHFTPQKLVVDGKSLTPLDVEHLLGCDYCDYQVLHGRFVPGGKSLDLLLWNTNGDLRKEPPQENRVVVRVLQAR